MNRQLCNIFLSVCLMAVMLNSCENTHLEIAPSTGSGTENTEGPENEQKPDEGPVTGNDEFVMLFTNDFHSQIEPADNGRGGAARLKALVDSVRTAEPAVLLADAGDLVQGTYYYSLLDGIVEAMFLDEVGYDVRTLGNHEFDKKMSGLGYMFSLTDVPVVATNYDFSKTSLSHYVQNSIILEAGDIKVGFIGMNIRFENLVEPSAHEGVTWQNAVNVADDEAMKLKNLGADIIIALSHLGYQKDDNRFYYDRGLVMNTRHIDMVIGGHTHTTLYSPDYVSDLDGDLVPIVQTGSRGANLGYAKIKIHKSGKPSFDYRLIPVTSRLENRVDQEFAKKIGVYTAQVEEKMEVKIAYSPYNIYRGQPESRMGNLSADGLIWMAKEYLGVDADVAVYNSGGIRNNIYKGDVTVGDVYAVYPFENILATMQLKGKDLKTLFNYVASSGGLPVNAGVRLVMNSSNQVVSVTVDGKSIVDSQTYTVATIDYVANLGRYGLDQAFNRKDAPEYIREYFVEYFKHLASQNDGKLLGPLDGRVSYE